jgi:DNA-binding transcriptional LysR family regulator
MNLAAVDLNLLSAFEALFAERSVSRAAQRVGLTQPAMSNALARLRALFGDELFVRTPREMRPTPRAREIAIPVGEALHRLQSVLQKPRGFDPRRSSRLFTIGASDNCDFAIGPAISRVRQMAPNAEFDIAALRRNVAISKLDEGTVDIVVGRISGTPKRFRSLPLYEERRVCVCNRRLELPDAMTPESFAAQSHLHVSHDTTEFIDEALAAQGLARRVAMTVPNFAVVPYALEHSDLIAVVGERVARRFSALPWIAVHELPFDREPWLVSVVWGSGQNSDPANNWLRKQLHEACSAL